MMIEVVSMVEMVLEEEVTIVEVAIVVMRIELHGQQRWQSK